ncbi:MAG: 30S ribosomal protein S16 [Candidatus Babeliales bacterium]
MAVKIRLSRLGKKNAPHYRVVAIDERRSRDGKFIENLGTYNPLSHTFTQLHEERLNHWVAQGAVMSDAVRRIHKQYRASQKA